MGWGHCTRERFALKDINTELTCVGRVIPTRRNSCDPKGQISKITTRKCGAKHASCLGPQLSTTFLTPSGGNMPSLHQTCAASLESRRG